MKKHKGIKRILVMVITMILLVAGSVIAVMADDIVAQNGEKTYTSLADAVADAQAGDTITMVADYDMGDTAVTVSKDLTLDLNGKTISGTGAKAHSQSIQMPLIYVSSGKLTIKDTGENGMIYNYREESLGLGVMVGYCTGPHPSLDVTGGTIKSKRSTALDNNGTCNISGGKVISEKYIGIESTCRTLTISGDETLVQGTPYAIDTNGGWSAETYIKGGKIVSTAGGTAGAIRIKYGLVEVSGGTIEGPCGLELYDGTDPSTGTVTFPEGSTAVINGKKYGSFSKNGGTVKIYGGYFNDDIGNGDEYIRPTCNTLEKVESGDHSGMYALKAEHDWGDWKVTTPATTTKEGVETRVCKRDDTHFETRPIAKLKSSSVLLAKATAKGKRAVTVSWNGVSGAQRYVIYGARCGKSLKQVKVVSASNRSFVKKGLRKHRSYKYRVVAQRKSGGRWVNIATSKLAHVATGNRYGRYTNPKNLTLNRTSLSLNSGSSASIKGTITKVKRGKRLFFHENYLRYTSNDPSVATVNASGKVTARAAGSCTIYVQAVNGMWKACRVTVK